MVSRGATAETPKLSIVGLRLQAWRRGKQGSDCDTPSFTARVVQYVMGLRPVRQKVQRLGQLWTNGQTGSKCTQERMTASTTDKPNKACRAGLCVHVSMRGTQENDYNIPSLTASEVQHGMGMCQAGKSYGGFVSVGQRSDWVQAHPGRDHSFALSFA